MRRAEAPHLPRHYHRRHRRHHVAHPQGLRQNIRDHRCRGRPGGQRRRPRHRAERPCCHRQRERRDRVRARGPLPRRRLRPADRRPEGAYSPCPPASRTRSSPTAAGPSWSRASSPRPTTTAPPPSPARAAPPCSSTTTSWPAPAPTGRTRCRSPRASSTTRRRPAAARWSRSAAAARSPSGWASPAPPPTAPAAAPLGHLADLRGDRGQGRQERLHQGPRLRLRGRPRGPPRQPRPQAHQGPGPLRPRGRRGRPQARPPLPHRGRLRPQRPVLPLDPAGGLPPRPRQAAHTRRRRGRAPGLQVLRLRRQVRGRPVPRHEDRHRVRRRLGGRTRP